LYPIYENEKWKPKWKPFLILVSEMVRWNLSDVFIGPKIFPGPSLRSGPFLCFFM
jgi:hypothetical protein